MRNNLIILLHFTSLNKGKIVVASIYSILNKICDIVPEILIGISIDVIVNQHNSIIAKLGILNPFYQLYVVGCLTCLLWILESIFEYLYSIAWRDLAQEVQHEIRLKTYDHLQRMDLSFFETKSTGQLLSVIQDDVNQLEQFLSQGLNDIIQLLVNIIFMGVLFLYISPFLAFLSILPIPFVIGITYYFQQKIAFSYNSVRQAASDLMHHIAYRLHGISTIKSFTTEDYELSLLKKESSFYKEAQYAAIKINAKFIPIVRMAVMVGFIMALTVGGIYALQGKIPLSLYATLVFLTQRFLWPFASVTTITDMYERTVASAKRILNILNTENLIFDENNKKLLTVEGAVKFENVSFSYGNKNTIFNNLNFEIKKYTTVAFVGSTGSGKSTIIKLLLRFYDIQEGAILLDNHDIRKLPLATLRKSIALVGQEGYLVEGTIKDNISYGTFNASYEAIIQASKMADVHNFIMTLPKGYDTLIEEHGKNLSGGQRQRIIIARALLKKSPILIFDEATSAIDNETEAIIQQSITNLATNHTIILIAHRLSTVRNADVIFVLEEGKIIEIGNHTSLLNEEGAYARLWKIQGVNI